MRGSTAEFKKIELTSLAFTVVGAALLSLPLFVGDYFLHVLILIFLYAYLGQAWNILGGYAGQLSLGHAAYFGLGAYTSTTLLLYGNVNPWMGLMCGGVVSAGVGLFTGYLCFRFGLKGPVYALATLAFAEIFRLTTMHVPVLGGAQGLLVPLKGSSFAYFQFTERWPYYYIALVMMVGSIFVVRQIEGSRVGYYLRALHKNEDAAEALGVSTLRYKLLAAGLSSLLTAFGGTFYAQYVMYIAPETAFGPLMSVEILLRPMIGGTGTVMGPVLGSIILTPLGEITKSFLGEGKTGVHLMIYGAVLIGVCLFMQRGLLNWMKTAFSR